MEEKFISDLSYTNKDFNTIYPELLDLVKKLTNKWDPSLSNESDPGVLLLKLNALIADKNNYNIDKNILECFPVSVTQEGNARKLYDMLGYNMHWYRSATTDVSFQLRSTEDIPTSGYTIKQFTSIVDSTGESIYTILNSVPLTQAALTAPVVVKAIEGIVTDYMINDSRLITVANLDNNLRLYFQDKMIAENGIFIADAPSSTVDPDTLTFSTEYEDDLKIWRRVENLASYPLGEKIYEFGVLPNSNTCYIEFPQDIASLIENGIYLKYTVSKGEQGNIKANILNLFYEDQEVSDVVINDSIRIYQPFATSDGEDPETLDNAYRNYKKTIGTFNTLVTERDYENFIYNLESSGKPLISNVNVSDRTDDINYSNYVQVWYPSGPRKELLVAEDDNDNKILNAYNIVLYLLNQPVSVYDKETYESSFNPCIDEVVEASIKASLQDSQSVQHDIVSINDSTLLSSSNIGGTGYKKFSIENTIALTGSLITYNKVSKAESREIETNVLNALYKKYNSRNVSFGSQIEYDDLVGTIQQADSRIKTVILNIPTYKPVYNLMLDSDGVSKTVATDPYNFNNDVLNHELIARMVIAGNVQLFKFDTDFDYDFGQVDGSVVHYGSNVDINVIKAITSETEITLSKDVNNQTNVRKNEVIQIIEPSMVTTTEYSTYVRYYLEKQRQKLDADGNPVKDDDGNVVYETNPEPIPAGQNYKLEYDLLLRYKDGSTGVYRDVRLHRGTIINSSVTINPLPDVTSADYGKWKVLGSGESISVKELNQSHLKPNTKCYFITNDTDNKLTLTPGNPKILQENEYFIYTNENSTELIILGSGTELSVPANAPKFEESIELIELEKITNENIEKIDWLKIQQDIYVTELKITNIGENSSVYVETSSAATIKATNTAQELPEDAIIHIIDADGKELTPIKPCALENTNNLIQSRLYINATQYEPQVLESGQSFEFTLVELDENGDPKEDEDGNMNTSSSGLITNTAVIFNNPIILSGGVNLDVKVLDDYGQYKYSLRALKYTKADFNSDVASPSDAPKNGTVTSPIQTISRNADDLIVLNKKTLLSRSITTGEGNNTTTTTTYEGDITFNFTFSSTMGDDNQTHLEKGYFIPVYVTINKKSSNNNASATIKDADGNYFQIFGDTTTSNAEFNSIISSVNRPFIIQAPLSGSGEMVVSIKDFGENDSITIGKIFKIDGYNEDEINIKDLNDEFDISTHATSVINEIREILPDSTLFDWAYVVPDIDKVLYPTSADSYWNENHIYNKYTIPKINFNNTKIKINPATLVQ